MIVVLVFVFMVMRVTVMMMGIVVLMVVFFMAMFVRMHVELHSLDAGFALAGGVEVKIAEIKLAEFILKPLKWHTQIKQRADKHIATNSAEDIEIKCFHVSFDS